MYVCICMYTHARTHTHTSYVCVYTYTCIHLYIRTHPCLRLCTRELTHWIAPFPLPPQPPLLSHSPTLSLPVSPPPLSPSPYHHAKQPPPPAKPTRVLTASSVLDTHPYTHTNIHSYTQTLICTYTHSHIHSYTHTLIHAYTHTLIHVQPPPPAKPSGGLTASTVLGEGDYIDPLARAVAEEAEKERRGFASVSEPLPPPKPVAPPPVARM